MTDNAGCIFCKIISGQVPAEVLINDDACLAFMDIAPLAEGHALLIPKGHHETLDQIPAAEAGAMLRHLPALTHAVRTATGCRGVNILQNNGKVAHQVVPHVHFHVIPRNEGDAFQFNWPAGSYEEGRMADLAGEIRKQLARNG